MEKEFIAYEQALALKELGFDEECLGWYVSKTSQTLEIELVKQENLLRDAIIAPLYQQAFRWFREKYGLHPHICYLDEFEVWHYDIYKLAHGLWIKPKIRQKDTYEEVELECLKKLIEIVKKK